MKNLKILLKESKKKNQVLEDVNSELKKDMKKTTEKNANVLDGKQKFGLLLFCFFVTVQI